MGSRKYAVGYDQEANTHMVLAQDDFDDYWFVVGRIADGDVARAAVRGLNEDERRFDDD